MDSPRTRRAPMRGVAASALQLPAGPWVTVLDCLSERFPAISRERWLSRMERGLVQDGAGIPLSAQTPHRVGLEVRYFREVESEATIPFEEAIIHADADLVVADKPHFLAVAPAGVWVEETLLARLIRRFDNPDLVPLHRLDRGTAGLVLFSPNRATRASYQALFRERRIAKTYEALAAPLLGHAFPLVHRSRLEPGEPFFRMREAAGVANSETRIRVLERGEERWRYELVPVTGRKHQLRVHMAALGAAILNDPHYPVLSDPKPGDYDRPMALLARDLEFVDPITGEVRRFSTGLRI